MPSSRGCRSSYDCIVKIKGVTTRPILFSQLMRSDGEGAKNPEELFADRAGEYEVPMLMRHRRYDVFGLVAQEFFPSGGNGFFPSCGNEFFSACGRHSFRQVGNDLLQGCRSMIAREESGSTWRRTPFAIHCFRRELENQKRGQGRPLTGVWEPREIPSS